MGKLASLTARQIGNLGIRAPRATARLTDACTSLAWYLRLRLWCERNPCEAYADRQGLYQALVDRLTLDGELDFLEFGTASGASLRAWLRLNPHPDSRFFSFDSFEGLPEAFRGLATGTFSTDGEPPQVNDPRCRFVKGLFQDSLPGFLVDYRPGPRRVIHLDADLYSSTLYVLFALAPRLRPGDLLLFDEFGIWEHEFRALQNFLEAVPLPLRAVARTANWRQVALELGQAPSR